MIEQLEQVVTLGWSVWRYRWLAVITAWVVGAAGVATVLSIPSQYEASARIYVDTQTILRPLMSGLTVQPNVEQQVSMLGRTLITRANVEKVAAMANLDLSDGKVAKSDRRIEDVTRELRIQSVGRDNLYQLAYRDKNPEVAKKVVDSMVSVFVQSSVGASRKDADSARAFIDEQIRAYQAKLEEAEAKLKDFRIRNIDAQNIEGKDATTRIAELASQLDAAKLQQREAEQAREAAKASLEAEKGSQADTVVQSLLQESAMAAGSSTPELDARIDLLQKNLDALLQRFTDEHPDVIAARRLVADLEGKRRKEQEALRRKAAAMPPSPKLGNSSLAYQELSRLLATAEVQLATAKARVAEYGSRLEQARSKLKDSPRIEAEAAQLNRDYAIHKKAYEELVARRESAVMYDKLDDAAGLAEFRVIEPARVPGRPSSPNRPLLLLAALGAAVGAGLGAAFVRAQIQPVFHRPAELPTKLGVPLLGAITAIKSEGDARSERWEMARLTAASGSLVVVFVLGALITAMLRGA
ncbi:MAG: XrtA system polysaccharide chain length determinant [Burkholderiaceae bacterium]